MYYNTLHVLNKNKERYKLYLSYSVIYFIRIKEKRKKRNR